MGQQKRPANRHLLLIPNTCAGLPPLGLDAQNIRPRGEGFFFFFTEG